MIYFTIDGANTPIEGATGISPDIQPPILSQRVKTPEKPSVVSWKFTHTNVHVSISVRRIMTIKACFFNNLLVLLNHQMRVLLHLASTVFYFFTF